MNNENLEKIPKIRNLYCNRCRGLTKHESLWKTSRQNVELDEQEELEFLEDYIYIVGQCCGCESISLEERYKHMGYPENMWDKQYYPKRRINHINPKFFNKLPDKLLKIYKESVTSFNSGTHLLCSVGLRSLIEGVCKDKNITGRNLETKIDGLSNILPENIVRNLHSLRFMGNDAVHELDPPTYYELRLSIEICEDLLNYLYELDYKTTQLKKCRDFKKGKNS